ncbi:MAG: glycerophosphodiester phosphodiesterase family protein, partial [archaeon]|nr:glycerophosphodiester phosphodiesterase family protein [archaeon]
MVTKIISHRGRTSKNSEDNTLKAVNDAINLKIDMVEVDIRRTKDFQIVCFHDPLLNGVALKDMTYSQIIDINPNKTNWYSPDWSTEIKRVEHASLTDTQFIMNDLKAISNYIENTKNNPIDYPWYLSNGLGLKINSNGLQTSTLL